MGNACSVDANGKEEVLVLKGRRAALAVPLTKRRKRDHNEGERNDAENDKNKKENGKNKTENGEKQSA